MPDKRKTIILDGLNLGLSHGTGIASYGRNLAQLLQQDYDVGVLYDRDLEAVPDEELLLQQRFYAPAPERVLPGRLGRAVGRSRRVARRVADLRNCYSVAIPRRVPGTVALHDVGLPNHPRGADIFSSARLFDRSNLALNHRGRPLRVRLPDDAMLHLTSPVPFVAENVPTILTVHDVIPLRMPFAVHDRALHFMRTLKALVQEVDHIVTVSSSAKEDLIAATGIEERKVTVTYQTVIKPASFDADLAPQLVENLYGLTPGEYFIFVGAVEPKKNIPRLIEAYLSSGTSRPLILVGPDGWRVDEQLENLTRHENARRSRGCAHGPAILGSRGPEIHRIGWVPRLNLAALVSQARAMLFPSLYEGFGLPVVEA